MPIKIGTLQIDLRFLSEKAEAAMKRVEGKIGKFSGAVGKASKAMGKLGAAAGIAGGVGGGGMFLMLRSAAETADQIGKLADTVGLTTDQLQAYQIAADKSGVSVNVLNSSLVAFAKRVGEARGGMGPLHSGLKGYNTELLAAIVNTENQNEALQVVADAMANAEDAADRATIANAAFSRSGIELERVFRDGSAGLKEYVKQATEFGQIISRRAIVLSEQFNDNLADLAFTIRARFTTAIIENSDALIRFANAMAEAIPKVLQFFGIMTRHQELAVLNQQLIELQKQLELTEQMGDFPLGDFRDHKIRQYKKEIEALIKRRNELLTMPTRAPGAERTTIEEFKRLELETRKSGDAADKAKISFEELEEVTQSAADKMADAMSQAAGQIEGAITSAALSAQLSLESLADLAQSILESIARSLIGQYIAGPIAGAIGGAIGNIGAPPPTPTIRMAQHGGRGRAGDQFLVGEGGPELLTLGTSGTIRPIGGSVVIEDRRGSDAPPIEVASVPGPGGAEVVKAIIRSEINMAAADGGLDRTMRANFGARRMGVFR